MFGKGSKGMGIGHEALECKETTTNKMDEMDGWRNPSLACLFLRAWVLVRRRKKKERETEKGRDAVDDP